MGPPVAIDRVWEAFSSRPALFLQRPAHTMKSLRILASASAIAAFASAASAQPAPVVSLTRLDCGTNNAPTDVGGRMSDTYAFSGLKVQLTFSCYIVRHGDEYLVWDTGNPVGNTPTAPKTSLVDLLGQLKLTPEQVKYVAISHYHGDHTGQVSSFPRDAAHRQGRLGRAQRREIS